MISSQRLWSLDHEAGHGPQNVECQIDDVLLVAFLMQLSFKFYSPVCYARHLNLVSEG